MTEPTSTTNAVPERRVLPPPGRRRDPSPVATWWVRWHAGATAPGQAGQSTVEYALVLLGAAAVALALVAWVTRSDAISRLFDAIVGRILSQAG
jgi:ABC-type nitrate/sulfonate/bicarbonate transport system permease component